MSKKVLFIDDSKTMRMAGKIATAFQNNVFYSAENGTQGIEIAKKELPDIIFLDAILPDQSGYKICFELKSNKLTSNIPVVLMTNKFIAYDEAKGESVGVDLSIDKPFDTQDVRDIILTSEDIQVKLVKEDEPTNIEIPMDSFEELNTPVPSSMKEVSHQTIETETSLDLEIDLDEHKEDTPIIIDSSAFLVNEVKEEEPAMAMETGDDFSEFDLGDDVEINTDDFNDSLDEIKEVGSIDDLVNDFKPQEMNETLNDTLLETIEEDSKPVHDSSEIKEIESIDHLIGERQDESIQEEHEVVAFDTFEDSLEPLKEHSDLLDEEEEITNVNSVSDLLGELNNLEVNEPITEEKEEVVGFTEEAVNLDSVEDLLGDFKEEDIQEPIETQELVQEEVAPMEEAVSLDSVDDLLGELEEENISEPVETQVEAQEEIQEPIQEKTVLDEPSGFIGEEAISLDSVDDLLGSLGEDEIQESASFNTVQEEPILEESGTEAVELDSVEDLLGEEMNHVYEDEKIDEFETFNQEPKEEVKESPVEFDSVDDLLGNLKVDDVSEKIDTIENPAVVDNIDDLFVETGSKVGVVDEIKSDVFKDTASNSLESESIDDLMDEASLTSEFIDEAVQISDVDDLLNNSLESFEENKDLMAVDSLIEESKRADELIPEDIENDEEIDTVESLISDSDLDMGSKEHLFFTEEPKTNTYTKDELLSGSLEQELETKTVQSSYPDEIKTDAFNDSEPTSDFINTPSFGKVEKEVVEETVNVKLDNSQVQVVIKEIVKRISREVIEEIVWQVVPDLAETIIKEELDKILNNKL